MPNLTAIIMAAMTLGQPPALAAYAPRHTVSGLIRISGTGLAGVLQQWEDDFETVQPGVRFQNDLKSGDAAIGAVESGAADLAVNGREPVLTEYLSFAEVFGNDGPYQVTVATGAYEKLGRTWAQVIYVNKDNPIAHLTLGQLDRIFGEARLGGYQGYKWTTRLARSAQTDIRTWGQLGLTGEWANKPIQTYGYAPTGMSNFFEQVVFHGGTTWNPNYRQYVEAQAKQATDRAGTTDQMMDDLSHDKYGIAWAGIAHGEHNAQVKAIAIGVDENGPFIPCTKETVAGRTYPLTRSVYIQLNRPPGTKLNPLIEEFLRFVLSREGQADVAHQGDYLPLTPQMVETQLKDLD